MDVTSRATLVRYFSFFFCGCAALLSIITISEAPLHHIRTETVILTTLFTAYAFILPAKNKARLTHTILAVIFLAITVDVAFLLIELPDIFSKFTIGFALFILCLSYGMSIGEWLLRLQPYVPHKDYEVDYQSLIDDVRGDKDLMQALLHETTAELITQLYREETGRWFSPGEPNSAANIKWELLAQAVLDSIMDGYAIRILELQRSNAQLAKPAMASLEIMMPLWRTYTLKQAKDPSSDFLKKAVKQLATHKVRLEQRKVTLASVSAFSRTIFTSKEAAFVQLGYKVAEFENYYRNESGKHEIIQIETSIEREFFELMDICEKLPLGLDGTQARTLLVAPHEFRFDTQRVHLACIHTDASTIIAALESNGVETKITYRDGGVVRRYELASKTFKTISPFIEVYLKDEETGLYSAADIPREKQFSGLADLHHLTFKGHRIKTVPPSFFLQQIIYCWADFPESKETAWVEDYNLLCKKYFSNKPLEQYSLFSHSLNYSKAADKEATFIYNH